MRDVFGAVEHSVEDSPRHAQPVVAFVGFGEHGLREVRITGERRETIEQRGTLIIDRLAGFRHRSPAVPGQHLHLAYRQDDKLIDTLAEEGIAYVPFFPLGGFSPLQSSALATVAAQRDATPMSVALAWLLQRSPNILLIPGTSSTAHLRENAVGAGLSLSDQELAQLDKIGTGTVAYSTVA
jgi:diketogulonate reductase-like aldo/keto reductase